MVMRWTVPSVELGVVRVAGWASAAAGWARAVAVTGAANIAAAAPASMVRRERPGEAGVEVWSVIVLLSTGAPERPPTRPPCAVTCPLVRPRDAHRWARAAGRRVVATSAQRSGTKRVQT